MQRRSNDLSFLLSIIVERVSCIGDASVCAVVRLSLCSVCLSHCAYLSGVDRCLTVRTVSADRNLTDDATNQHTHRVTSDQVTMHMKRDTFHSRVYRDSITVMSRVMKRAMSVHAAC